MIQLSAQSIPIASWRVRLILNDIAELEKLKAEAKEDSISIQRLELAYHQKDSALTQSQVAMSLATRIKENVEKENKNLQKEAKQKDREIRKQKFLKWLFIIDDPIIVIFMVILLL